MNRILTLLIILITVWSCGDDDDGIQFTAVPIRSLSEVAIENDAEFQAYFQTHFYNYEEFDNPPAGFDFKIVIDTIAGDNADRRPLSEELALTSTIINVSSDDFGLEAEENDIPHVLYTLTVREGEGPLPTVGDSTVLRYEGTLVNGNLFDAATTPIVFYPPTLVRGFSTGITGFGTSDAIVEIGDGTLDFGDYGIGAIFIPSGLGFFQAPTGNIPQYSNLIFTIDNLSVQENTDFDQDGIPSILEDLNGDGNLNNDNTDADDEQFNIIPNHADPDDDGDGRLTLDEISDDEGNIIFPYPDTDGDGTPDYLDSDS